MFQENEIITQMSKLRIPEEVINIPTVDNSIFEYHQLWEHITGIFRRKEMIPWTACTGATEIIKQIREYIPKHPEIEFRFSLSNSLSCVDFQLEYSNGLDRIEQSLNPNSQIVISVKNVLVERKFFDEFVEWLKTTSYSETTSKNLNNFFFQFSKGKIVNFNYFSKHPNDDYASCVCPVRAWCGVLTNGEKFGEERVRRLIQIATTGCWDAIYPGSKTELLTACKGHTRCEFEDSGECQGDLEVVTTSIRDDYWQPKVEGAIYCAKHAPPGLKSPVYWIADHIKN